MNDIIICKCGMNYYKGIGIGVCKACGGETCTSFGCFVTDKNHDCRNVRYSNRQ